MSKSTYYSLDPIPGWCFNRLLARRLSLIRVAMRHEACCYCYLSADLATLAKRYRKVLQRTRQILASGQKCAISAIKVYRRAFAKKGKHAFYMRLECREPNHL